MQHTAGAPSIVDLIIFSYHRPLQLYALLESLETQTTGLKTITVIYRADTDSFEDGYTNVRRRFPTACYIRQSAQPYQDFKPLLMNILTTAAPYIAFAVDDIIITESFDFSTCATLLEKYNAYGFYVRLGTHVDICYSENKYQGIPPLTHLGDDLYSWRFDQGRYDWNYPHTLDMAIYRTQLVLPAFTSLTFYAPNSLEGNWAGIKSPYKNKKGLCFATSKIVNIPLNVIQKDWGNYQQGNRNMQLYTCEQLLAFFNEGLKIDVTKFLHIKNRSAHADIAPTFITR